MCDPTLIAVVEPFNYASRVVHEASPYPREVQQLENPVKKTVVQRLPATSTAIQGANAALCWEKQPQQSSYCSQEKGKGSDTRWSRKSLETFAAVSRRLNCSGSPESILQVIDASPPSSPVSSTISVKALQVCKALKPSTFDDAIDIDSGDKLPDLKLKQAPSPDKTKTMDSAAKILDSIKENQQKNNANTSSNQSFDEMYQKNMRLMQTMLQGYPPHALLNRNQACVADPNKNRTLVASDILSHKRPACATVLTPFTQGNLLEANRTPAVSKTLLATPSIYQMSSVGALPESLRNRNNTGTVTTSKVSRSTLPATASGTLRTVYQVPIAPKGVQPTSRVYPTLSVGASSKTSFSRIQTGVTSDISSSKRQQCRNPQFANSALDQRSEITPGASLAASKSLSLKRQRLPTAPVVVSPTSQNTNHPSIPFEMRPMKQPEYQTLRSVSSANLGPLNTNEIIDISDSDDDGVSVLNESSSKRPLVIHSCDSEMLPTKQPECQSLTSVSCANPVPSSISEIINISDADVEENSSVLDGIEEMLPTKQPEYQSLTLVSRASPVPSSINEIICITDADIEENSSVLNCVEEILPTKLPECQTLTSVSCADPVPNSISETICISDANVEENSSLLSKTENVKGPIPDQVFCQKDDVMQQSDIDINLDLPDEKSNFPAVSTIHGNRLDQITVGSQMEIINALHDHSYVKCEDQIQASIKAESILKRKLPLVEEAIRSKRKWVRKGSSTLISVKEIDTETEDSNLKSKLPLDENPIRPTELTVNHFNLFEAIKHEFIMILEKTVPQQISDINSLRDFRQSKSALNKTSVTDVKSVESKNDGHTKALEEMHSPTNSQLPDILNGDMCYDAFFIQLMGVLFNSKEAIRHCVLNESKEAENTLCHFEKGSSSLYSNANCQKPVTADDGVTNTIHSTWLDWASEYKLSSLPQANCQKPVVGDEYVSKVIYSTLPDHPYEDIKHHPVESCDCKLPELSVVSCPDQETADVETQWFNPLLKDVISIRLNGQKVHVIEGLQIISSLTTFKTKPKAEFVLLIIRLMNDSVDNNLTNICYKNLCQIRDFHFGILYRLHLWKLIEESVVDLEDCEKPETVTANVLLLEFIAGVIEDDLQRHTTGRPNQQNLKSMASRFLNPDMYSTRIKMLQTYMAKAISSPILGTLGFRYLDCLSRLIGASLAICKNLKESSISVAEQFWTKYCQLTTYDHRKKLLNFIRPHYVRMLTISILLDRRGDLTNASHSVRKLYITAPLSLKKIVNYYFLMEPLDFCSSHKKLRNLKKGQGEHGVDHHSPDDYVELLNLLHCLIESFMISRKELRNLISNEPVSSAEFNACISKLKERIVCKWPSLQCNRFLNSSIKGMKICFQ